MDKQIMNTITVVASVAVALTASVLWSCGGASAEKAAELAREDLYNVMGTKEGDGKVTVLEMRTDSAYAPYENAQLFDLVAEVGMTTKELRQLEPSFLADSLMVENMSRQTAHMVPEMVDSFMDKQKRYVALKDRVDKMREDIQRQTQEVARIINTSRGFCGYKVTATVKDETGQQENIVFITDTEAKKVLLRMRESDYEEVKRRMAAGMEN